MANGFPLGAWPTHARIAGPGSVQSLGLQHQVCQKCIPKDRPLHVASRVFNQNGVLIGMVMNISLKCASSRCASITILEWPLSNHQQLTRIFLECWKAKKQQIWKIPHLCIHKFPRETDGFPYVAMFLSLLEGILTVVPHKAVAEVSKIGHYRRGELW